MMMMFPMMMVLSMVGMFMGGAGRTGKAAAELNEERKDYFRYLANLRVDAAETAAEQRRALEWSHPDPRVLPGVVGTRRMWERRPADTDFCHVRVGVGTHRLATRLLAPGDGTRRGPGTGVDGRVAPLRPYALGGARHAHRECRCAPFRWWTSTVTRA